MNFTIGNREIGNGHPAFIIAELSANHNQDFEVALKTIQAAKDAGADAIKLQTYTADTITIDSDKEYFQLKQGTLWDGKTLHQLYREAYTPWDWQPKLKAAAEEIGLICFSSPFDFSAVDFLEKIDVPAYKIASFEIVDIPLIEYTAAKGKPIIMSTGIASIGEIQEAVEACRRVGNHKIALLKCTSEYPAPVEQANLAMIANMRETFNVPVGLSDHTLGISVPVVAVALGACIIEKHFILDKSIGGPDAAFSLDTHDFKMMTDAIRDAEKSIGTVDYSLTEKKEKSRRYMRSLFVTENVQTGEVFTEQNVRSVRPGHGLAPKFLKDVIGKHALRDIEKGTPVSWDLLG
jgi:pseudaminic acid synthase